MKAEESGKLCRGHWGVESMHWWLDAVMNEDYSRITYKHASEKLSRIRQMCMNFIKLVEMKGTLKRRQLKCALNTEFRESFVWHLSVFNNFATQEGPLLFHVARVNLYLSQKLSSIE
jgi:hypothetical protein